MLLLKQKGTAGLTSPPQTNKDMNKQRKEELTRIVQQLGIIMNDLQSLREEEDEAYNKLPDLQRNGDEGARMDDNINAMDNACDFIGDALQELEDVIKDK